VEEIERDTEDREREGLKERERERKEIPKKATIS